MKRGFFVAILAGLMAWSYGQGTPEFVPGQVLVKFKPNSQLVERALHLRLGTAVIGDTPQLNIRTVRLPSNLTIDKAIREYKKSRSVLYAQRNYVRHFDYVPNDPMYNQQYAHQRVQSYLAWDITQGSPTVKIAILDSGCDTSHPDLSSQMLPGWDFVNNDPIPEDDVGHGTHVAGDAAAATDNGIGVAGPGFNCKIIPVKVGGAGGIPTSAVIAGLTWIADQGANVANMSFGGWFPDQAEEDAVNYAWSRGVVLCASAGNDPVTDEHYPAAFPNCIAVAASNQADQKADFSTYGPWVDVASPGVAILSTTVGGGYEAWDGTSMSSPVCAGVVGLIWSVAPNATNTEIRALLENNCDPVGNWVVHGRINAFRAVSAAPIYTYEYILPSAVTVAQGTYMGGDLGALANNDFVFYRLNTVLQRGVGYVAAANIELQGSPISADVKGITLMVNAQGAAGTTGMLYLWDRNQNKYVWFKSFPMNANSASVTVNLPVNKPYSRYFDSTGKIKVAVRGLSPSRIRSPFQFAIDRAMVELKVLQP